MNYKEKRQKYQQLFGYFKKIAYICPHETFLNGNRLQRQLFRPSLANILQSRKPIPKQSQIKKTIKQ